MHRSKQHRYSITSSGASRVSGMVRPSELERIDLLDGQFDEHPPARRGQGKLERLHVPA
jgi:hypothetical protein